MAKYTRKNQGIVVVKKSNQLIEARYKFDIWETRVFLSVLANIKRDDEDFKVYRIWYRDVIRSFGLKSGQSYGFLRDAARSLIRKVFNISNEENGFQRETEYHIIRTINYLTEGEESRGGADTQEYIDITIDPDMKPLLLQLKNNFTAYDLRNVVKLGAYPVRVYELLKQYESIGERTLDFEEMKRMFELTTEYPHFANFYQKIIQPAIVDINEHTDIIVTELERIKSGKKVVGLRFGIQRKSDEVLKRMRGEAEHPKLPFPEPEPSLNMVSEPSETDRLFTMFQAEVVQGFGVSPSAFLAALDGANEIRIAQAVRVTRRAQAVGQIKNLPGFFMQALKDGYTDPQEEGNRKKQTESTWTDTQLHALTGQLESLELDRRSAANAVIRELTNDDPFLAGEAINKIMLNAPLRQILESKTGLSLDAKLPMDTWRQTIPLRDAVARQIEAMHPDAFKSVKMQYDLSISKLKLTIDSLSKK